MKPGIQAWFAKAGDTSCLSLNIIEAGRPGCSDETAVYFMNQAQTAGLLADNFIVRNNAKMMELVAGGKWSCRIESEDYIPKLGEISIEHWAYTHEVSGYHEHFGLRRADGTLFDTLGSSQTLKRGKCVDKRIFTREAS